MHSTILYDIKEEEPSELSRSDKNSESASISSINTPTYLIGIIADEDTCVGYLLGGIGELNSEENPNYFLFSNRMTNVDIEEVFYQFLNRSDIGILLIQREAADLIHHIVHKEQLRKCLPVVIEIPSKNGPYEICIDHLLNIQETHHESLEKEKEYKIEERRKSSSDVFKSQMSLTADES